MAQQDSNAPPPKKRNQLGSISTIALIITTSVSVVSVSINFWQVALTRKFQNENASHERYRRQTQEEDRLRSYKAELIDGFIREKQESLAKAQIRLQMLTPQNADWLKEKQHMLVADRESRIAQIIRREQQFSKTFGNGIVCSTPQQLARQMDSPGFMDMVYRQLRSRYLELRNSTKQKGFADLFAFVALLDSEKVRLTTNRPVHVRERPGETDSRILTSLTPGQNCFMIDREGSWIKVRGRHISSFEGWIYARYLNIPDGHFLLPFDL